MISVPLAQAKNQLSELINRVESGETVAVTRRGRPVAQLIPCVGSNDAEGAQREQADREQAQRVRVAQAFERLRQLRGAAVLEGDIKAIAREGLD